MILAFSRRNPREWSFRIIGLFAFALTLIITPALARIAAAEPITTGETGSIVHTYPFTYDTGDITTPKGNHMRFITYGYAFDPVQDGDLENDYYLIFGVSD